MSRRALFWGQTQRHVPGTPSRRRRAAAWALAAAAASCFALVAPAHGAAAPSWHERLEQARDFARGRAGKVWFAVTTEDGTLHGRFTRRAAPSASVLKAMLLVAYLNRPEVRDRPLDDHDRSLLGPMIRRSSNPAANRVVTILGPRPINRLARRAGMRRFVLRLPVWGLSEITARDQARFFRRIDSFLPRRHRRYAMRLLATVVPSQRWGIAPEAPDGWKIYFKGGWGSGTGRVTHQVALLEKGGTRISLAVLTQFNPSQRYGQKTIRGIAARLFRGI